MPESEFTSGASAWSDEEFLRAFEDLSFPADLFHHGEHIRVAWLYLKSSDASRAAERMSEGIRRFANHHGATQKYHHTLTLAWIRWWPPPWWKHRRDTRSNSSSPPIRN